MMSISEAAGYGVVGDLAMLSARYRRGSFRKRIVRGLRIVVAYLRRRCQ